MSGYTEITPEVARTLREGAHAGPVTMLNLLRFREEADYSHAPHLAPDGPISGREAYARYMKATQPMIARAGARLVFRGNPAGYLIGPRDEQWDLMLLVEYDDLESFFAHTGKEDTRETLHHRQAALADSRLLPVFGSASPATRGS
ncbi:DUF1330 domain-containing protein [Aurantiacibacter spongiae]|uniref:DUF1330 domain-containing protein n=1 Tax=Aurantiacibacter spongiae TaxID=2488860 RepID=A0A3N5DJF4_9SPHN|nr:DUF1330 domain-containing protein [Aurantiacibacter spongiae]RPF71832.1 DUF1330 domain-containing protein [Aurantiacibacter spongiae]